MILQVCDMATVADLVARFHGYGSMGKSATYAFAVYEQGKAVAAFSWQPPPAGAAKAVCPEAPAGVLALSRMMALPKVERELRHISKPLKVQMLRLIDRGRWPVLLTYSDAGQGHTGHVYKCSGWQERGERRAKFYLNAEGKRASCYSNGQSNTRDLTYGGETLIKRWEHWVCERGQALAHMQVCGWVREPTGGLWKSGNMAYRWVQAPI